MRAETDRSVECQDCSMNVSVVEPRACCTTKQIHASTRSRTRLQIWAGTLLGKRNTKHVLEPRFCATLKNYWWLKLTRSGVPHSPCVVPGGQVAIITKGCGIVPSAAIPEPQLEAARPLSPTSAQKPDSRTRRVGCVHTAKPCAGAPTGEAAGESSSGGAEQPAEIAARH